MLKHSRVKLTEMMEILKNFRIEEYLNLKRRQMLIIMGMSSIVLSMATAAFFLNDYFSMQANIRNNLSAAATFVGRDGIAALQSSDHQRAAETLRLAAGDVQISAAALYDDTGLLFSAFTRGAKAVPQNLSLPVAPQPVESQVGIKFAGERAVLQQPLLLAERTVGWLYIEYDLQILRDKMSRYASIALLVFGLGMAIAWLMTNLSRKLIIDPIWDLAALVDRITRTKNYSERMPVDRSDEIGILMRGFNAMLDTIQERENELQKNGDRLESLIELRTKQLHHRANYDSLTKLPNRHLLMEKLQQVIEESRTTKREAALLLIDVDRFKIINDSLGHHVGDELLQQVAQRISGISRGGEYVGRLGGDEFVILLGNMSERKDAERVAKKILSEFASPFELKDHKLHVSASIGITIYPQDAGDAGDLLKRADISMYRSKSAGMGAYLFYDSTLDNSDDRLLLENRLRNAVRNSELYMLYQPQVSLEDGRICGLEALMRWRNPEVGELYPTEFVPVAEEIGIMHELTLWAIDTVCRQYQVWMKNGVPPDKISVNISASDLSVNGFVEALEECLRKHEMDPGRLELEITEAVFIDRSERIINIMRKLKSLGIAIAIDDFGTGYSGLSYLQDFPIDMLKLDGSFIRNIVHSEKTRGIITSAIALAHGLGLKVVAECVDTEYQRNFLVAQGCDIIQGFYFCEPMTGNQLEQYLADGQIVPRLYKTAS
jgi:diguanylate cyclase (GGDEF)-like protein